VATICFVLLSFDNTMILYKKKSVSKRTATQDIKTEIDKTKLQKSEMWGFK
jgi:hypothetical protein